MSCTVRQWLSDVNSGMLLIPRLWNIHYVSQQLWKLVLHSCGQPRHYQKWGSQGEAPAELYKERRKYYQTPQIFCATALSDSAMLVTWQSWRWRPILECLSITLACRRPIDARHRPGACNITPIFEAGSTHHHRIEALRRWASAAMRREKAAARQEAFQKMAILRRL